MKTLSDTTVSFSHKIADTLTALGKIILQSKKSGISEKERHTPLIIMANGPSLRDVIDNQTSELRKYPLLAVNFAANTPEFMELKPRYYVLADPHFFNRGNDPRVATLIENFDKIDWEMTLFVPMKSTMKLNNQNIAIERFNMVGIDGNEWIKQFAFRKKLAMPRPRNVLIPSIMIGIWLGYKEIYIVGADHSWTRTLSVNDRNEVISVQPHFYKDDDKEQKRVDTEYLKYPLHQIIHSFYVAFRAYHDIERFARTHGVNIYNSTSGSFIDAFRRKKLGV